MPSESKPNRRGSKWRQNDLFALQVLQALPGGYLPWSKWSLRPAALVAVLNDVVTNGRRTVVECGSGLSTVYLARLLREREGRVHSLEDDPAWAAVVEDMLRREGLSDVASVVRAPLEPHSLAQDENRWYAQGAAEGLLELPIDLLLVDGPHGGAERKLARYPALPFFRSSLTGECAVVLDDIQRPGEQEIVDLWTEETGMAFRSYTRLSLAVATSRVFSSL